jgi:catechol 2,3-dioxygenase-like lactoylglutathione lyase family enzyme
MTARLAHLQMNVDRENLEFYEELVHSVGWKTIHADDGMLGVMGDDGLSIWFVDKVNDVSGDYDGCGLNHLALGVDSIAEVDKAAAWLTERGIEHLFGTPRHRPEFSSDDKTTYYQVMFESPDKLLFEIVFTGPLQ